MIFSDADLAALRVPVSLMWGAHDPFGSTEMGERIARACKARWQVVDSGHLPWIERPAACADAIAIAPVGIRASC